MRTLAARGPRHAPIFIIGAPRTGSTILYQALTNYFEVLYIDNLAAPWNRALFFGMHRSAARFGQSPHNSFSADHGNTARGGPHAPSECGDFWYRWLPRNQHFVASGDVSQEMVQELRDEVNAIQNRFRHPLIFKNLNVGQRLSWVTQSFPDARFIFVRRDVEDTIASILRARQCLGVPPQEWWSTKPSNHRELLPLPERERTTEQVRSIERQIEADLKACPPETWRTVQLSELGPESIEDIGEWLGLKVRPGGSIPLFRAGPQRRR